MPDHPAERPPHNGAELLDEARDDLRYVDGDGWHQPDGSSVVERPEDRKVRERILRQWPMPPPADEHERRIVREWVKVRALTVRRKHCQPGAGRRMDSGAPAPRRTSSSSRSSGNDPGDDEPDEPPVSPPASAAAPSGPVAASFPPGRSRTLPGLSLDAVERLRLRSALADRRAAVRDASTRVAAEDVPPVIRALERLLIEATA